MTKVNDVKDIWELKPTSEDLLKGARYALISLPWTFNRMALNTGSIGQRGRALNIAKGIVGQEVLRRALESLGIPAEEQNKSHRDDDFFDLRISSGQHSTKLDLKTWNNYTDYSGTDREPLTREFLIQNAGYAGSDWRKFFPMLVPVDQTAQGKDIYCFAAAKSIDFRTDITTNRHSQILAAFPYAEYLPFLSARVLCSKREEAGKGISLSITWRPNGLFNGDGLRLKIFGEFNRETIESEVFLEANKEVTTDFFSCVSSFSISPEDYALWNAGYIDIKIKENSYREVLLNSLRRNINRPPVGSLIIQKSDFCNLVLPDDYTIYFLGWITKDEFLEKCRSYTGWVWPIDKVDKYQNTPWNQITEADEKKLTKYGFGDCINKNPSLVKAGWLKTTGKGGGACCYMYPNIGRMGGIKDTNIYVLIKDLYRMECLGHAYS